MIPTIIVVVVSSLVWTRRVCRLFCVRAAPRVLIGSTSAVEWRHVWTRGVILRRFPVAEQLMKIAGCCLLQYFTIYLMLLAVLLVDKLSTGSGDGGGIGSAATEAQWRSSDNHRRLGPWQRCWWQHWRRIHHRRLHDRGLDGSLSAGCPSSRLGGASPPRAARRF